MIRYMLKTELRSKESLFYIFLFPLFMLSLYALAFSGIESDDFRISLAAEQGNLEAKQLAYVPIFDIRELDVDSALEQLNRDEITGFIQPDGSLLVKSGGFAATVAKSIMDTLLQVRSSGIPAENFEFGREYVRNINVNSGQMSFHVIYYAFFGMIAMQSAHLAMSSINSYRANQSGLGIRIESAPTKRSHLIFSAIVVALLINSSAIGGAMMYTVFVLGKDIFPHLLESIAILFALNMLGVVFGIFIGAGLRTSEMAKSSIITAALLFAATLSGMMNVQIKNLVSNYLPFLAKINPMTQFADAINRINLSGDFSLFYSSLIVIGSEILILWILVYLIVRRRKYDSL